MIWRLLLDDVMHFARSQAPLGNAPYEAPLRETHTIVFTIMRGRQCSRRFREAELQKRRPQAELGNEFTPST
jgi:hypothetical protein